MALIEARDIYSVREHWKWTKIIAVQFTLLLWGSLKTPPILSLFSKKKGHKLAYVAVTDSWAWSLVRKEILYCQIIIVVLLW